MEEKGFAAHIENFINDIKKRYKTWCSHCGKQRGISLKN